MGVYFNVITYESIRADIRKKNRRSSVGWSKIIWDLINCTGMALYRRKEQRGNYLDIFLKEFNEFDDYDKYFKYSDYRGDDNGLPIMFIIVQDRKN